MQKEKQNLQFGVFLALVALVLSCGFFIFAKTPVWAEDSENTEEENEELEEDIDDTRKKIEEEEAKRQKLLNELNQIQGSVNRTSYEISKTQSFIDETKNTISRKEAEIKLLNEKIELQKVILTGLLREIYYGQNSLSLAIMPEENQLSQFMGESDHLSEVERQIVNLINDIKSSKEKIEGEKTGLKENQDEQEKLLSLKHDQQQSLLSEKYETQGNIQEKDATIAELNAKLYQLRSNLSGYLGESYDAGDIEDAAKFASKATGVRRNFIMGMLVVESNLGRFTGGCTYKEIEDGAELRYKKGVTLANGQYCRLSSTSWNTFKNRTDKFESICEDLDYNYKKQKVSCNPSRYCGTGGAMGVAQFMPDTWLGYINQIASFTGHNPPDPWDLTDGVVGMALKLAKGGATSRSGECNAAKLYLSGTTSSYYDWYCYGSNGVLYWADNYERLLD